LVPAVRPADLLESHAGVRAQALSEDGQLVDDFWFDYAENVIHVRNAPSPGATSSLALAREIVQVAEERASGAREALPRGGRYGCVRKSRFSVLRCGGHSSRLTPAK